MAPRPRPLIARIWEKIDRTTTPDGCWPWKRSLRKGYPMIGDIQLGTITVTRWLLARRIGRELRRSEVARHTCDNAVCCRPDHLIVGTRWQNSQDASERRRLPGNRMGRGMRQVLSDEDVVLIRKRYAVGGTSRTLAEEFGVTPGHIRNLVVGRFRPAAGGPFTRRIFDVAEAEEAV